MRHPDASSCHFRRTGFLGLRAGRVAEILLRSATLVPVNERIVVQTRHFSWGQRLCSRPTSHLLFCSIIWRRRSRIGHDVAREYYRLCNCYDEVKENFVNLFVPQLETNIKVSRKIINNWKRLYFGRLYQ